MTTDVFALPPNLSAKADPLLIGRDQQQLTKIAAQLENQVRLVKAELTQQRLSPGGAGRAALDRDQNIHRLSARLRVLERYGLDVCLGRFVRDDDSEPVYVGRIGVTDDRGDPLLIDWRTPAAEPFFAATQAHRLKVSSRRRYRWSNARIVNYWDEILRADGSQQGLSPDDQSAFIASLDVQRQPRMRDVLGTIQADQDAIIRADSQGTLVVDGGPGTGKTVVALHRAAYLTYADPRLAGRRGGILFVGPPYPYLHYIEDVLPSLGEEGVQICTVRDLVPEGAAAVDESEPLTATVKERANIADMIDPAVRLYEEPPTTEMVVETVWDDVVVTAAQWAQAFASVDPGIPHNEARDQVWDELLDILVDEVGGDEVEPEEFRAALTASSELGDTFRRAWPILDYRDIVSDLWSVPAYLRRCAPWLSPEEVKALYRPEGQAWTVSDIPLLDAAQQRLGDRSSATRARQYAAAASVEQEYMDSVVHHLIAADYDGESVMTMLHGADLRDALVDEDAYRSPEPDRLAGPFAHIVVDEAQELTDAQWQLLIRRCPLRSFTVVGDRAQARDGFTEGWTERLVRAGLDSVTVSTLTVNYRTPQEIMVEAEPVIRSAIPDANVPVSVRSNNIPVTHGRVGDQESIIQVWLADHPEGTACVVGDPEFPPHPRVQSLSPENVKGLEFDLVVVIDPDALGGGITGAVDRYVAMTRATQRLVILHPSSQEAVS